MLGTLLRLQYQVQFQMARTSPGSDLLASSGSRLRHTGLDLWLDPFVPSPTLVTVRDVLKYSLTCIMTLFGPTVHAWIQ